MDVMQFVLDNWSLFVTVALMVLAVAVGGQKLAYFRWAAETFFFAWDHAEKEGLVKGWPGYQKLDEYVKVFREKYREKFLKEPGPAEVAQAIARAAELSLKEKAFADPLSPPSGSPEAPAS